MRLYQRDNKKQTDRELLASSIALYRAAEGRPPAAAFVHPTADLQPADSPVPLERRRWVTPGHVALSEE